MENSNDHQWNDPRWLAWTDPDGKGKGMTRRIDDDALGYMVAEAAKDDGSDAPGSAIKRRGPLEVTRAISLTPFAGDITFNAKSGNKTNTSLYGTEVHATRYQYGFGLTPEHLHTRDHALAVVDAVAGLSEVAGNQSRFLYDFSPEAVVFRWTDDFAPRMLYGFASSDEGRLDLPAVLGRLKMGDLDPSELVVGLGRADLLTDSALKVLESYGVKVTGIVKAAAEVRSRMERDLGLKE